MERVRSYHGGRGLRCAVVAVADAAAAAAAIAGDDDDEDGGFAALVNPVGRPLPKSYASRRSMGTAKSTKSKGGGSTGGKSIGEGGG